MEHRIYVYFIYCLVGDKTYVKIGKAKDPRKRLAELQTGCPVRLSLEVFLPYDSDAEAFEKEREFHERLKRHRHDREWFVVSEEFDDELSEIMDIEMFRERFLNAYAGDGQ